MAGFVFSVLRSVHQGQPGVGLHVGQQGPGDLDIFQMQGVLDALKVKKALVVLKDNDQNVLLSARNIADVETATPATINTYDVMKHNTVVVTKDAVASIEEVYA